MKLSEAIMLGSTNGKPLSNDSWDCCLVGMGVSALLETSSSYAEASVRWPWLDLTLAVDLDGFQYASGMAGRYFVTALCTAVIEKRMTLEQAVDAIRQIEPAEPVSEPQATEGRDDPVVAQPAEMVCRK